LFRLSKKTGLSPAQLDGHPKPNRRLATISPTTSYLLCQLLPRIEYVHPRRRCPEWSTDAAEPAGVATVESYEVDGGVVFYDAENPLAWVETTRAVSLSDLA